MVSFCNVCVRDPELSRRVSQGSPEVLGGIMTGSSTFNPKATPCQLRWSLVNTKPCSQTHVGVLRYSNEGQSSLRCWRLSGLKSVTTQAGRRRAKQTERFTLDDISSGFVQQHSRLSQGYRSICRKRSCDKQLGIAD